MKIGDLVHSPHYGHGEIVHIIEKENIVYYHVKFKKNYKTVVYNGDAIGNKLFLLTDEHVKRILSFESNKLIKPDELKQYIQEYANQTLSPLKQERDELQYAHFNRKNGEIVGWYSENDIKYRWPYLKGIIAKPFNFNINYYDDLGVEYDDYFGANDISHSNRLWVHSLKSEVYGQLVMNSRLGKSQVKINNRIYHINLRRDISFTGSEGIVGKVTEFKMDKFTENLIEQNADEYLINLLSKDELYLSRKESKSDELGEIFYTMTNTQHIISTAPMDAPILVQGGAGTGKTSIGLHRIAYLLYNNKIKNAIAIGPSDYFAKYVEKSLKQLGDNSRDNVQCLSVEKFYEVILNKLTIALRKYPEKYPLISPLLNGIEIFEAEVSKYSYNKAECNKYDEKEIVKYGNKIKNQVINEIENCLNYIKLFPNNYPIVDGDLYDFSIIQLVSKYFDCFSIINNEINCLLIDVEKYFKITKDKSSLQKTLIDNKIKAEQVSKKIEIISEEIKLEQLQLKSLEDEVEKLKSVVKINKMTLAEKKQIKTKISKSQKELGQLESKIIQGNYLHKYILKFKQNRTQKKIQKNSEKYDLSKIQYKEIKEVVSSDEVKIKEITELIVWKNSMIINKEKELLEINNIYEELNTRINNINLMLSDINSKLTQNIDVEKSFLIHTNLINTLGMDYKTKILNNIEISRRNINRMMQESSLNKIFHKIVDKYNTIDIVLVLNFMLEMFPELMHELKEYNKTYFFIDEVQDLTYWELILINRIVKNKVTLVGDINQNIFNEKNKNWNCVMEILNPKFYTLDYNWRSTSQIVRVANQYIVESKYKNIGIVSGNIVNEINDYNEDNLKVYFNDKWYEEIISSIPTNKKLAIITTSTDFLEILKITLSDFINQGKISVFENQESIEESSIILTCIDYAKGLEYYSVIAILPTSYYSELTYQQRTRIYTTLTRATDTLLIIHI